ncbi:hypothetical protein BX070DRAFT_57903 [Coemansia spiralis]|nr:hypothetical protein BX070DRAFT_57903 [Coemansia spiralis]
MLINTFVKGLLLMESWRHGNNKPTKANNDTKLCQGANITYTAQCRRLYGGVEFKMLPKCTPKEAAHGDPTIDTCLQSVDNKEFNIMACNSTMFGSEFPQAYKQCIAAHSGVSYMNDCNICLCQCNGYSICTKRGCVHPISQSLL